ncbi:MAG: response regulator [Candidatus Omnitrophota bacterium]|nr:response regulator [Candidatus Omnitrophota bacterium]
MSKKILIVDDEIDITLVLKEFFISKGYEALAAFNGREAVGFLNQPGIDLILLDMQMPDMSGLEVLKEARKIHKDTKIIVLTGFSEEYKEEAEKIGCDAFLTKPFSIRTLITAAESVLTGKEEGRSDIATLMEDDNVLAKAKLLFIEPNEITYGSKLSYFRDLKHCKGRYRVAAAFTENEAMKKLEEFKPDIVLSDIGVFRLYKLRDKILKMQSPAKDIILYGLSPDAKDSLKNGYASFVGGLFDPITAMVSPEEMDRLGKIVRRAAMEHGLYKSQETETEQFYNYHKVLLEASKGMVLITDTSKLLYLIVYVVKKHMKLKSACIFYYDEQDKSFVLTCKRGESDAQRGYRIGDSHPFIKWLKDRQSGFSYNKDDFMNLPDVGNELEKLGCAACVPSFNKDKLIGFLILGNKLSGDSYAREELELLLTISNEAAIVIENAKNVFELQKLREKEKENYFQTILALARTVDEKDAYTRGHLDEVTRYGVIVAEELTESLKINIDMEELKTALLLHDIGKIGVPDALLHKISSLTPEEFEIMKQHSAIGARIIEPIEKLKKIGRIIKHHQEKYNGTGYPDGLKGEDIPLESRIVAVVDAYHAMISDRPYRKALPEDTALNELRSCRGTQFDPLIVDAFLRAYEKGKIVKRKI